MKKTGSFGSRTTPKKQTDSKTSSLSRSTGKVGSGPGSAAFNRRSPVVVTEGATIATSSVIQAAADPKIKELVMKQQQIFERESMDKRTPRNRETASALFHSLDHPHGHTSPHHASHGQSNLWKHTSFGEHAEHPSTNETLIPETPERLHGKFSAISPDAQQQQHHHFFHHPATPGSAVDTVVHPQLEGHATGGHDDDGVSSELTSDATYMTLQRSSAPHLPTMNEHVAASPAAHATAMSISAGSPSMRQHAMHTYMDMNSALLHEHGHGGQSHKDQLASPLTQVPGGNAHGLPMPPPLSLPQAASSGIAAEGVTPPTAYHPSQNQNQNQSGLGGLANLDPSVLDDQSLRNAYLRLLMEMETRGLHSLSLNPSLPSQGANNTTCTTPALISHTSSLGSHSNGNIQTGPSSTPSHAARRELQESPSLKPPSTAHTALPPHLNPNVNPVDIRKNVPRSKSGGSESAFYPNAMFPGASQTAAQAGANLSERSAGSGRKTPNSPLMGRYMHTNAGGDARDSLVHEELHWAPEPEEVELRRAFGQHRHPGSPSYPAYSPFPHLSASVATGHVSAHASAHGGTAHHGTGNTPTSVAVGSANWSNTGASVASAAPTNTSSSHSSGYGGRPASRCSGVIPQLDHFDIHMRHNCLSTLPQTHSQYMYTHSVTAHMSTTSNTTTMGNASVATNGTASGASGASTGASGSGANGRSVDLKTPKFVRKFQGIGAGSLGLTVQRYAHVEEEGAEDSSVSASVDSAQPGYCVHHAAPVQQSQTHLGLGLGLGQQNGAGKSRPSGPSSSAAGPAKQSSAASNGHINGSSGAHSAGGNHHRSAGHHHPLLSSSSDMDNSIDAVKIAGGLDNLLLPNRRSSKRNNPLIPDEHSAFDDCSLGSMSMNSARSAGKKSAKTR